MELAAKKMHGTVLQNFNSIIAIHVIDEVIRKGGYNDSLKSRITLFCPKQKERLTLLQS